MVNLDDKSRVDAEHLIEKELAAIGHNPAIIRDNGCAACHVLFTMKEAMQVSEQDAADLLSEVLLDNQQLNDRFITTVEDIHMKARLAGGAFAIKTRDAKDRYIDANFKNTLNELASDSAAYGSEIVLRKLILSSAALGIAQNLGIDYHAATEELYYYMRKNDSETHEELMKYVTLILGRGKRA